MQKLTLNLYISIVRVCPSNLLFKILLYFHIVSITRTILGEQIIILSQSFEIYTCSQTLSQRRLDTITWAQKVGILPHTKSKSRTKASAALLDESMLKSMRKDHLAPYPGRQPLQLWTCSSTMCILRSCDYNINVRHVQPPLTLSQACGPIRSGIAPPSWNAQEYLTINGSNNYTTPYLTSKLD